MTLLTNVAPIILGFVAKLFALKSQAASENQKLMIQSLQVRNDSINMAYSEKVIEHYEKPRNIGSLDSRSKSVGTGLVGAPECGDVMKLQIQVDDDNKIVDAKFKTFGCGSAIASSSLATEWIKNKTIDEASMIQNTQIVEELSLPPVKIHCSVLAEDAIKSAIKDYQDKQIS